MSLETNYFERIAENIVNTVQPGHHYYDILMGEDAPATKDAKKKCLLEHWKKEKQKAIELYENIETYYMLKIEKKHETESINNVVNDNGGNEDFNCFLEFDRTYDLKPYRIDFNIDEAFYEKRKQTKGLFLSAVDNYAGKYLNLYLWTRVRILDLQYGTDICEGVPDTRFGQKAKLLNEQKCIIEMFSDKIIDKMFIVNFHPLSNENYEIREVDVIESK